MSIIYPITTLFETNNVANKGLMELGGYALPGIVMANNRVEARERAEKAGLAFGFSFLTPFICLPLLNKGFLKYYKVAKNFSNGEHQIMRLSRKYLSKNTDYMLKGINELKQEAVTKNKSWVKGIDNILEKYKGKEDELKKLLIKASDKIIFSDILSTGLMMGSIYWISNAITKRKTGRDGFSAEYKMADKDHVESKAQKYKENKNKNVLKAMGILLAGALGTAAAFRKGMMSKNTQSILKKFARTLDYKEGIFMSRAILLLITLFGDIPNTLLSSRDKEELKYNTIKNSVVYGTFFGGDLILNNVVGRILDKTCKNVNLVNKEGISKNSSIWKKLTAPLYTLKEIGSKTNWNKAVLEKTKRVKTGVFWANFAIVTAFMGFGTPYLLNKMVKKNVDKELTQKNKSKNNYFDSYILSTSMQEFIKQTGQVC